MSLSNFSSLAGLEVAYLNPEGRRVAGVGWRVAVDGWDLPQYSYLSPAKLGLALSLAIFSVGNNEK